MPASFINAQYEVFADTFGAPLQNGFLYVGLPNLNPETSSQAVFWDEALSIPAAQPVRTIGGYPSRNGSPGKLFVGNNYSMTVKTSTGALVWTSPSNNNSANTPFGMTRAQAVTFIAAGGASINGGTYFFGGLQYIGQTGATAISDMPGYMPFGDWDFKHFGAIDDDATNNTTQMHAAFTAAQDREISLSGGIYRHGQLVYRTGTTVLGKGGTMRPIAAIPNTAPVLVNLNASLVSPNRVDKNITFKGVKVDGSLRVAAKWLSRLDGSAVTDPQADYVNGSGALSGPIVPATFTASFSGGAVTSVAVNTGGSGYGTHGTFPYSAPTVQLKFTGGGGYGATGYGVRTGTAITSVVITDGGWNYTSAPAVTTLGGHADIALLVQPAVNRRNPNYAQQSVFIDAVKIDGGGVMDCEFSNYPFMCVADEGCRDFRITGNEFNLTGKSDGTFPAIWVQSHGNPDSPPVYFQNTENSTVQGNTFRNLERLAVLFAPTKGGICSDNKIDGAKESGIFLSTNVCQNGGTAYVERNAIENVAISDIVAHGIEVNAGARNIKIRNNRITLCVGGAISLIGVIDCEISSNHIVNCGGSTATIPYGPYSERKDFNAGTAAISGNNLIEPVIDIGYATANAVAIASNRVRIEDNSFIDSRGFGELRSLFRQSKSGVAPSPLCRAHRIIGNFVQVPAGFPLYDASITGVFETAEDLVFRDNPGLSAWNMREDLKGNLIERRLTGQGTRFTALPVVKDTMARAVSTLALRTGHRLLLDAGDVASYASGQVWTDVSGSGNNYNRGTTSGAEASDPTFNGIAGDLSDREFWSLDGGDYFTPSGVPTFGANWHKPTAKWSFAAVIRAGSIGTGWRVLSTMNTPGTDTGLFITISAGGLLQLLVYNAGVLALNVSHSVPVSAASDTFIGVSIDQALALGGCVLQVGEIIQTPNGIYVGATASAATAVATLLAGSSGGSPAVNNSRLSFAAAWDTFALNSDQMNQLFYAQRTRWTNT